MGFGGAIFAPEGAVITDFERGIFREFRPFGFIVFARNVQNPDQLRRLCADLRDAAGHDAPILVDQEGGRVQRLRAPHWREWLPPLTQMEQARDPVRAMWLRYRLIAQELRAVGLDGNCAPCLDITARKTHPFLRNRCYGGDVQIVADAGRAVAEGLLHGGVLPVMKHIPGHGLATLDSHKELPRINASRDRLERQDFAPFQSLADLPMAMTAHVVYEDIDDQNPATTSSILIDLIRGHIGFAGLLMSDDLSMEALQGSVAQRASQAIAAGCDVALHCNGKPDEIVLVAEAVGAMSDMAQMRAEQALARRLPPQNVDISALAEEFDDLMQ